MSTSRTREKADKATFTQAEVTAKDTEARAGRKNLILNGSMQISQRGDYTTATAASHNNYYLDRWLFESGLSQTVQDTGFKQKVVVTAGGTNIVGVRQKIEDKTYNRLLGKTITLSAKVTSNSSDARICSYADGWRVGTAHTGGGSEETLTLTYTVPSSLSVSALMLEVAITGSSYSNVAISTGDYIEFTNVQLELGSVATDFEHRSYGEELQLCQRYFNSESSHDRHSVKQYHPSYKELAIAWPVEMRAAPTFSYTYNGGDTTAGYLTNKRVFRYVGSGVSDTTAYYIHSYIADAEL